MRTTKNIEKLAESAASAIAVTIDDDCRKILVAGSAKVYAGTNSQVKIGVVKKMRLKIKEFKIWFAEKIGGEDLHGHCNY